MTTGFGKALTEADRKSIAENSKQAIKGLLTRALEQLEKTNSPQDLEAFNKRLLRAKQSAEGKIPEVEALAEIPASFPSWEEVDRKIRIIQLKTILL